MLRRLLITLLVSTSVFAQSPSSREATITIASFNIQIFGKTKAGKPEVMEILAETIRKFDIVAIQEIRNKAGTAITKLRDQVNETGRTYEVVTGARVGHNMKEQYAYIYDTTTITPWEGAYDYDDDGDEDGVNDPDEAAGGDTFEREPYVCGFRAAAGDFDFVLINIHTDPDIAETEIPILSLVVRDAIERFSEEDVICLGDYNADGSYYDEDDLSTVFPAGEYLIVVSNSADTNVAASDRTYDRIVMTSSTVANYTGEWESTDSMRWWVSNHSESSRRRSATTIPCGLSSTYRETTIEARE